MIEQYAAPHERGEASLVIRPNRAMSRNQLIAAFSAVACASIAVAGFSWSQGNAFAPLFALAELGALATCLWLVWLSGMRYEVVAVSPGAVSVRSLPELREAFSAHPQWVRLSERDGRVLLVSRGREVEVGACLGEAERQSLATRLRHMIGAVSSDCAAEPARAP